MYKLVDRRIRKTKKQLSIGLTKLLQEKSVKEITVRELSDLADINRGTFYIHYSDIFDMVEQIENEMFEEFNEVLNSYPPQKLKDKAIPPLPMLIDIFSFLSENADMCRALLGKNGDIAFVEKLKSVVKNRCLSCWMSFFNAKNVRNFEYYNSFIVSGFIGLFESWLANGMQETPEQMAVLFEQMIKNGVKVLEN